jgi:hypothetical protein
MIVVIIIVIFLLVFVAKAGGENKNSSSNLKSFNVDFPNPEIAQSKTVIDAIDKTYYAEQIERNLIAMGINYEKYKQAFKDKISGNFDKYKYYKEFSVPLTTMDEYEVLSNERKSSFQNSNTFNVAGAFVKNRKSHLINNCSVGDEVVLVPEPKNPHDSQAIRIRCNGKIVGYVPREDTEWVHKIIKGDYYAQLIFLDSDTLSIDVEIELLF